MLNDNLRANPDISVTDELDSADAAVISDGLRAYYLSQTGYYDFRPLAVFVRDPQTGKIIGGLHGRSEFRARLYRLVLFARGFARRRDWEPCIGDGGRGRQTTRLHPDRVDNTQY